MAKNYIGEGSVLEFTNSTGSTIASGSPVLMGKRLGIALTDILDGTSGAVAVEGVFAVAKLSTDAPGQGALLYWDATNSRLTTTASGNTQAGYAASAAINGDTTVNINLNQ